MITKERFMEIVTEAGMPDYYKETAWTQEQALNLKYPKAFMDAAVEEYEIRYAATNATYPTERELQEEKQ